MATYYWVGGSSTLKATDVGTLELANTSGGTAGWSVPTSADNIIFDANSGPVTVDVESGVSINSITTTGFTGTLNFVNDINVYGSITLGSATTVTRFGAKLRGSSTGNTITTNGKTIALLQVNGSGNWTCQDAATFTDLRLTLGTLKLKSGATTTISGVSLSTSAGTKALSSSTPGSAATISDASGINSIDYITVTDITATGGATWQWGAYVTDGGGNTGWSQFVVSQAGLLLFGDF